jgi:hypothetical protein
MHDNQGAAWEAIPPAPQGEGGLVGNRPANRARHATPGVLSQGWQAREGAVDFLGLDQELGGSPAPAETSPEETPGEGSWLLDAPGDASEAPIEQAAPVEEPEEADVEAELDAFVPAPPIQASWVEAQRRSGKRKVALRAAAVIAVGAVGFTGWQILGSSATNKMSVPLSPESNPTPRYEPALALKSGPGDAAVRERAMPPVEPEGMAPEAEPGVPGRQEVVATPLAQGPAPVWVDTERLEPPPEADALREAFGGGEEGMLPTDGGELGMESLEWTDSSSALEPSAEAMPSFAESRGEVPALAELSPVQPPAPDAGLDPASQPPAGESAAEPAERIAADSSGGEASATAPPAQIAQVQPIEPEAAPATEPAPGSPAPVEGAPLAAELAQGAPAPAQGAPLAMNDAGTAPVLANGEHASPVAPPAPLAQAAPENGAGATSPADSGSSATSLRGLEALGAILSGPNPAAPSGEQAMTDARSAPTSAFDQLVALAGSRPGDAQEMPPLGDGLVGPADPTGSTGSEASREASQTPSAVARAGRAERTSRLSTEEVLEPTGPGISLKLASQQDLSSVWTRSAIPFDAIGSPTKVLTPMVGRVRLVLKSKELFEGRLYAVGEGHVWLDTQYGRMGLPGARVDRIEQIEGGPGTPALGAPGSEAMVGLERVRVKTPGGVFYGKVISKDESKTTLVTEQGARITLDSKDVEYLTDVPKVSLKSGGN